MINLPRLNAQTVMYGQDGKPTQQGQTIWNTLCDQIESNLADLQAQETALAAAVANITAAQTALAGIIAGTTKTSPDTTVAYTWTAQQTYSVEPVSATGYKVGAPTPIQVVGAQQPAIATLAGAATLPQAVTAINTILAMLRVHGLIAP
jgi:hypothetical protein